MNANANCSAQRRRGCRGSQRKNEESPRRGVGFVAPIISAQRLGKRFGATPLFREISFTVSEGNRIGIVGPNGSGKSTLLAMLDGRVLPDSGDVAVRKGMRVSGVQQISEYAAGDTVRSVVDAVSTHSFGRAKLLLSRRLAARLGGSLALPFRNRSRRLLSRYSSVFESVHHTSWLLRAVPKRKRDFALRRSIVGRIVFAWRGPGGG